MAKNALKILVLSDLSVQPPEDHDFSTFFGGEEWKAESQLIRTLRSLGHEVRPFGIFDSVEPLLEELRTRKPDLVFNLCEAVHEDRHQEPNVVSLLELLKIPYTGAPSRALQLCKDKGLTKKILAFHDIRVPQFTVSKRSQPIRTLGEFRYPALVKPLNLEASEGIAQISLCENEKDTLERARFIHNSLETDAIIEEYIEGRELYVSLLGSNKKVKVFPSRELTFGENTEDSPKFATYKAKWDDAYRKRWGIKTRTARGLPTGIVEKLEAVSRDIYDLLQIGGYARLDFRLMADGTLVFIEANPNPSLDREDDFALSAEKGGLPYDELVQQIVQESFI